MGDQAADDESARDFQERMRRMQAEFVAEHCALCMCPITGSTQRSLLPFVRFVCISRYSHGAPIFGE